MFVPLGLYFKDICFTVGKTVASVLILLLEKTSHGQMGKGERLVAAGHTLGKSSQRFSNAFSQSAFFLVLLNM